MMKAEIKEAGIFPDEINGDTRFILEVGDIGVGVEDAPGRVC